MFIPVFSKRYRKQVTGTVQKQVICEKCGNRYDYRVERAGEGEGESLYFLDNEGASDRAASRAAESLEYKLQQAVEAIPCPQCNWVQEIMVRELRRRAAAPWWWIALGLPALLLLCAWIGYLFGTRAFSRDLDESFYGPLSYLVLGAVGCLVLGVLGGSLSTRRINPNASWQARDPVTRSPSQDAAPPLALQYLGDTAAGPIVRPRLKKSRILLIVGISWLLAAGIFLISADLIARTLGEGIAVVMLYLVFLGGILGGSSCVLWGVKAWQRGQ